MLLMLTGITILPSGSSTPTPTPTFDFLNVPGDNETIEEAYSWLNEGGTIMVASGTHLVGLSIQRNVNIVSAGGAESTTLRPRYAGGTLFTTNAPCTISGFTVEGNGTCFVATSESTQDVVVSENIINNATVLGRCPRFVFTKNVMDGVYAWRYLKLTGEEAQVSQNDFLGEVELKLEGNNCTLSSNSFDDCGVRITGDYNTLDRNQFQDRSRWWGIWSDGRFTKITNNTFDGLATPCLESLGFFEVVADNSVSNCTTGFYLKSPGGSSKLMRNNISDSGMPISVWDRDDDCIQDNEVWSSVTPWMSGGLVIGSCSEAIVSGNLLNRAAGGIVVTGDNCTVEGNVVSNIRLENNYFNGISVSLADSEVKGNQIRDVRGTGLALSGNRNLVESNLMQGCMLGLDVYSSATGNQLLNNDLIDNNQSCYDSSLSNTWDHNLFSDYSGPDLDGDGIGDLPYLIPGGNQDPHPRIYREGPQVGEFNIGILPINFPESPKHAGQLLLYPYTYYEDLGKKLSAYWEEASYGSLKLKTQVLRKPNDLMFSLDEESAVIETWDSGALLRKIIEKVDSAVDFRAYDYDPQGGRGVVAIVLPYYVVKKKNSMETDTSAFFRCYAGSTGYLTNVDGTSIDLICCFAQDSKGDQKVVLPLAHEVGHFLGKLLITNPNKAPGIGEEWTLPDEYLIGNVKQTQSIMGHVVNFEWDRIHPDSFCKLWLDWLEREDMVLEQEYALKPLPQMQLHDKVLTYDYYIEKPGGQSRGGFYIFEARTRYSPVSTWDTQTQPFEAVNLYQVDVLPSLRVRINLVAQLAAAGDAVVVPDLGVALQALSVFGTNGTKVRVTNYTLADMTGATILPNGNVLKRIRESLPSYLAPEQWPDTDLHAYAEDGKHVGMNYATGEYEVQIPGAICSGDLQEGREWIYVPSSYNPRFVVSSADTESFLDDFPSAYQQTDGLDTVQLLIGRYGADGAFYTSGLEERELAAGITYEVPYEIVQNENGSYSVGITDIATYQVSFTCTGLPTGTPWTVRVDGTNHSSATPTIQMVLAVGSHSYSVVLVSGYEASPSSGNLQVSGAGTTMTVEFSEEQEGIELPSTDTLMLIGIVMLILLVVVALVARSRRRRRR